MDRLTKLMCALAVLSASVVFCGTAHGAPILLKARTIEPEKEAAKPRLMATSATGGKTEQIPERGLYLIQHNGIVTPEWREQLEQCGAIIRSYMPENAYMIEAGPEAYNKIISGMAYSYFAPFETAWKIHSVPEAANSRLATTASSSGGGQPVRRYYSILIFEETALSDVVAEVEKLTGQVVKKSEGCMIWAMLNAEEVRAVAALPDVHAVSLYVAPRTCNNVAVQASRMNVETVWPNGATGLNLTGAGQVIAVADTGLDTGDQSTVHNDVKGRILSAYSVGRKDFNGKWDDFNGHGTHVVGSVLGNGSESNNKIRGVAYEASLVMQSTAVDPTDPSAEIWDPYSQKYIRKTLDTGDVYILLNQAYTNQNGKAGARIHSNSWGAPYLGEYSEHDNRLDKFMFEHPDMLVVVAAGNNGIDGNGDGIVDEDSLNTPSSAKNCITVGGTENYRKSGGYADIDFRWGNWIEDDGTVLFPKDPIKSDFSTLDPNGGSIQGMIPWSSRGPCDDGRVKPDIVAPGHQILSLYSSKTKFEDYDRYLNWKRIFYYDDHYCYMQGTSMSCPLVSGSAALVRQWLQESRGVANPDGATIKAVLLAGAKSLCPGQYGAGKYQEIPKDYPNNVEGWGQVNMGNTVGDSDNIQIYDAQVIAYGENVHTFTVNATAGQPLTIIMAYTDAPSSPDSVGGLQNDLDMVVITPSDNELYPNSRTTPDKINNVEGVRLKAGETETGVYTIKVSCARIGKAMSTSLTGGKKNATRYSLVVNGAKEPGQPPDPPAEEKPNLTFVTYTGWPEPAFLSAVKDDPTSVNTFEEGDDIYLWGCYANTGVKESSACKLALELYANDVLADSAERDVRSLKVRSAVGGWQGSRDDLLQGLPAGSYKLCIKLDSGKSIDESNEDDNDIMISFTVAKKAVPIPGAPASLNVSAGGDKLTVSWNAVSGAVKYNVYRSTTSSKPSSPLDTVSAATAYSDGNVAIGTTYYYWVAAVNSEGKEGTAAGPKSGTIDLSLTFDDSSTRQFDAKGGNGSVVVTANANWSATVDKSWVRFGVQNGGEGKTTLRFSVDATGETSDRTATITVSAGGGAAQKTLAVSQKGIQANPALGKALDSTGLSFFTGGDSEWVDVSLDDTFATAGTYVRSGALAYGQTGWVETIVSGSGTLQFRYGVSGMAAGTFALIVDGSEVATFSTILGQWKYGSYNITSSGSHRIRWEYRQNGNATLSGTSYAMLDDVSFGAVARARPAENVSASSGASGITLNWTLTGGDVSSFNVWRATSLKAAQREKIKTMSASGNGILDQFSCTDGTCQQGITYYYWIESVNASGSAVSEAVSAGLESEYVKFFMPEWKLPAVIGTTGSTTNLEYSATINFHLTSDVDWMSYNSDSVIYAGNWHINITVKPNTGADDRHGTLTATDAEGVVKCVLPVMQAGLRRNPEPLVWYVDGTKGDDGNDGANWYSAKKTIQAAIDVALSGDEVVVADGNYMPFSIVDKIDISVRSLNGWDKTVVVNPEASTDPEWSLAGPVVYIYGYSNKITGFTVDGTGYSGNMGGCVRGGTWNRCKITNGNAWRGGGAHTATLISCLVTGNVAEQGGGTFGCELINCTVTGNATKGSSGKGGGTCGGTSQNTIIWGNETTSVDANCSGGTHNYCCTYPLPGSGTGNIDSDPLLMVVDGVCSLGTASPCLNAGRSDYTAGELDLVGNPRIGNGVVDIGAIEDLTVAPASPAASIRAAQTGSIKIDIQATSRATEYIVYRSVSSSPRPGQAHATVNATANAVTVYIDDDDVLPGVEYWYWIAAKNEAGESTAVLIGKGYRVPSLNLNGSPLQFLSDGGTLSVGITTDAGWAAFVRDGWASVSPSAGDGNGQIAVSALRNEKTASRDTILSVVAGFGTAHPVTNTLSIVQSAAPAPVYRASFHANGGQGDMGALDFQDGAEQALSPCGFTRTGYAFAGWSLEPDGEAFYSDGQAVTLQKNATLYAVWTPVAYTVVFHSNDGTRKSVRQEFVYDAEQSLTANSFVVVGGEFMGWAVEENGGVVYQDKQDVVNLTAEADGEVSLYAVWRALPVSAPVLDTALAVDDMTISISVKQTENAKAYRIYRSTDGAEPSTPHDEVPADGSSVQTLPDMDAEPGIEYHYWVSAVGIGNNESAKVYCGTAYRRVSIAVHGGNDVELVSIGEAKDVPVLANSSWEIELKDGDWFSAEKTIVRYDDREQNVLRITAKRTTAYRQGSVTLVAGKETQHPERVTVAVLQMIGNVPEYGPWGDEPIIIMDNVSPTLYDDIIVTFDGEAMAEGDMVALYDQSDRLRAVGKVVFYNGALTLSVSMNVSAGTSLRIVAWRHDTDYDDLLIVSQALIVSGDVSIIEEEQHWTAMHGRPLELLLKTPGWNQISFNVLPDDASPETVFGEVADKISSVIDGNQNYLNWRPGKGGTLEEITVGAGYWVFAKEVPVRWTVTGTGNPSVTIKLAAGWNMIGYPLYEERPVAEVLKTAIERNLIKTIVDGGHNWPKGTLTTLAPGKGYWFYAQQDCTITFDNN